MALSVTLQQTKRHWMGVRGAKPMAEPAVESLVRLWCVSAAWRSCGCSRDGVVVFFVVFSK